MLRFFGSEKMVQEDFDPDISFPQEWRYASTDKYREKTMEKRARIIKGRFKCSNCKFLRRITRADGFPLNRPIDTGVKSKEKQSLI